MRANVAGFEDAFIYCVESVYDLFGEEWIQALNYPLELARNATSAAINEHGVRQAADLWRECMAKVGLGALPELPIEMPTDAMRSAWETSDAGQATELEIAAAVADTTCRTETRFTDALYAAEWDAQFELVNENRDRLESGRQILAQWQSKSDEVLGAHVAERP